MASIYIIKSKTSGKCYIGQTSHNTEYRWKKHLNTQRRQVINSALYLAIDKYGVEDFEISTLCEGNFTRKELNTMEINFIKSLSTLSPNGYNLNGGGNANEISEETRKKKSDKMKGRNVTWGNKVSVGVKKLWQNPEYRNKQTKQRHQKRGKYRIGIIKPQRLKLDIDEINRLYKDGLSINKIAKKLNVCWTSIQKRITV